MKKERMSLTLAIVFFIVAVLIGGGVSQTVSAAKEPMKIIGKLTVPAGAKLVGLMGVADASTPFLFVAFDEQSVYVMERFGTSISEEGEVMEAGYLLLLDGFRHNCPAHGLEVMEVAVGGASDSVLKSEGFKLELF